MTDTEIKLSANEQILGWLTIYLVAHYQGTGFEYKYQLPKGKGRKMVLYCGESAIELKVKKDQVDYEPFVKAAMKEATLKEQERIKNEQS